MTRTLRLAALPMLLLVYNFSYGQTTGSQLPQMMFKGAYTTGHKDFNIYKMYDQTEDVLCYIMMPTLASKKDTETGQIIYDSNSIGALSCMKIFAAPSKTSESMGKKK